MIEHLSHAFIAVAVYLHWLNRPWVRDSNRKIVTDPRLGKIGQSHFDSPTKNCFDYGCTDDCPVAHRQLERIIR